MRTLVDFNVDAGESLGRWRLGADRELMPFVTSVSVACGWHAGDPMTMRTSVRLAKEYGVALGTHPGLPDLVGFGRRAMNLTPDEAATACLYQLGALTALAAVDGVQISHVKPHGALYGMTMKSPDYTEAITDVVMAVDPSLIIVLLAGPTADVAAKRGARVAREAFADLEYNDEGHIIIEPDPQAKDPDGAAQKMVDILNGKVQTISGQWLEVDADTVCIHGDRPNAVEIAAAIRKRLDSEGVAVRPMREVVAAG